MKDFTHAGRGKFRCRIDIDLSILIFMSLSVCLSVRPSVCLSVHPSVCLSVCPSVRPSVDSTDFVLGLRSTFCCVVTQERANLNYLE